MATGSLVGITPGQRPSGLAYGVDVPEASSQTFTLGAPVTINASGVIAEIASNGTLIFGFAQKAGQNGASDGAKTAKVFKVLPNERFEGTLSVASWDQSLVGSKVGLSKISSTWCLVTATAISSIAQAVVLGVNSNWQKGDTNPVAIFSILNADQQGGV